MNRVQRLQASLNKANKFQQLLVTNPINLNYLTNLNCFTSEGREGLAYINNHLCLLFVSPPIYDQIPPSNFYRIVKLKTKSLLAKYLKKYLMKKRSLGFETKDLKWQSYNSLKKLLGIKLQPTADLLENIRVIKDNAEIINIKKACQITKKTFTYISTQLRPGRTETQIGWIIEKYLREHGAENLAFPIIVASGANSSIPHYQTGKRKIKTNDIVLIDAGCKVEGYCSDMSRTFFNGKPKTEWLKVYEIVAKAQKTTINILNTTYQIPNTNPIEAKHIDRICRDYIKKEGFGNQFIHSTGHGIGLEIHEKPRISPKNKTILKNGMIFTIEPGIYLPGKFGVRIEDVVIY